jgi:hypothetical protein
VITDNAGPLTLKRAVGCVRLDSNSARCWPVKRVALDLEDRNDVARNRDLTRGVAERRRR